MPLIGLLLLSLLPVGRDASQDSSLGGALADLASPSAAERFRAERWIATRVQVGDFPELAAALEEGDLELRTRVVRALGAEDRNLGVAVLLAGELRPTLRTAGRAALEEMLLRWAPELAEPALVRGALRTRLLELHDNYRPELYELDLATPLSIAVGRLARNADAPLALVVDPVVADLDARDPGPSGVSARGVWDQMLVFLAERDGLGLEGFGLGEDGEGLTHGFLRVCRLRDEGRRAGLDLVLEWIHDAAHADLPIQRTAGARALAATEWPAAVRWLGQRWFDTDDTAALEGALVAAARGRVAPALARPGSVQRILAAADADLAASEEAGVSRPRALRERAWLALDGLRALPPIGAGGGSLVAPLLADWEASSARQRWLRLAVVEGMAPGAPGLLERVAPLLADASEPLELRLQALRVAVGVRPAEGPIEVAAPAALLAEIAPFPPDRLRDAAHRLVLLGVDPAQDWEPEPAGVPSAEHAAALAEWCVGRGRHAAAARVLAAADWRGHSPGDADWEGSRAQLTQRLVAIFLRDAVFQGQEEAARAFLAELERSSGTGTPGEGPSGREAVRRVALLAGLPGDLDGVLGDWLAGDDPEVLGALAAGGAGEEARERLKALVEEALPDPGGPPPAVALGLGRETSLRLGLERALEELLLAGEDRAAERFLGQLRRAASASPSDSGSALRARLLQADWPPAPRSTARRLAAPDPRLRPGALAR